MLDDVQVVPFGRPATRALARAVEAAKAGSALRAVTVVVPTNLAGLGARRMLGGAGLGTGGMANVNFVTPLRLAQLVEPRPTWRRPLTTTVLAAAVRRALAERPGRLAVIAGHPATEAGVIEAYTELSHLDPPALRSVAAAGAADAEMVRLHHDIRGRISGYDDEGDLARAVAARADLAQALRPFGPLVWFLPGPVTPALGHMLAAAFAAAPATAVVGLSGAPAADESVLEACRRAGAGLVGTPSPPAGPAVPHGDTIISVTDADEEVRAVLRRVVELAEGGTPLHRIGIFYPTADPYLRILVQQLDAAGVAASGPDHATLADAVASRCLLQALGLPEADWRRDDVLALTAMAPLAPDGLPADPAAWTRMARDAGVVSGLADWERELDAARTRLATRVRSASGPEAHPPDGDAREVERLAGFVAGLGTRVGAVTTAMGWTEKSAASRDLLEWLLGAPGCGVGRGWPRREEEGARRLLGALDRLATVDAIEPEPSFARFRRALGTELDVPYGRRGVYGTGVFYGPLSHAVGQDLDAVFILGAADGQLPVLRGNATMISESGRAASGGGLRSAAGATGEQYRHFLAALAAAPQGRRVLTYARGDLRDGTPATPSRWLLETASALAGRPVATTEFDRLGAPVVTTVASFASGVRAATTAPTLAERDLQVVLAHLQAGGSVESCPEAEPTLPGLRCQQARRSALLTEWDGNLQGVDGAGRLSGRALSASALQRWAHCGFRYFLHDVVALDAPDDPKPLTDLSPKDQGSLLHTVLERFYAWAIETGPPEPDRPWSAEERAVALAIAADVCADYAKRGRTGRPLYWRAQHQDLITLLERFLDADDRFRRQRGATPWAVEREFGGPGREVAVEVASGREVRFTGRIDRVDATTDGSLVVTDYKSGKGHRYRGTDNDPVLGGRALQLGVYAEAALQALHGEAAEAEYRFLQTSERVGYRWTAERRARFVDAVASIVDSIGQGVFPADPGPWNAFYRTHDNCRHCEFDRVCPSDRGDYSEAKRHSPELDRRTTLKGGAL